MAQRHDEIPETCCGTPNLIVRGSSTPLAVALNEVSQAFSGAVEGATDDMSRSESDNLLVASELEEGGEGQRKENQVSYQGCF